MAKPEPEGQPDCLILGPCQHNEALGQGASKLAAFAHSADVTVDQRMSH